MGVLEILLIIGCAALVISVITVRIVRRKQGKVSCDCGCDCCPHCSACASHKAQDKK